MSQVLSSSGPRGTDRSAPINGAVLHLWFNSDWAPAISLCFSCLRFKSCLVVLMQASSKSPLMWSILKCLHSGLYCINGLPQSPIFQGFSVLTMIQRSRNLRIPQPPETLEGNVSALWHYPSIATWQSFSCSHLFQNLHFLSHIISVLFRLILSFLDAPFACSFIHRGLIVQHPK